MPLVSIIMPVYNAAPFIGEAINSVKGQDFTDWELVVVDDGSTDESWALIQDFEKEDPRIRCFRQPNSGQGLARRNAIERSKAEWLALLDADDTWMPGKLTESLSRLQSEGADLFFAAAIAFENDKPGTDQLIPVQDRRWAGEPAIKEFLQCNRVPALTAVFSKRIYVKAGGFNNRRIAEDYQLWLSMLANDAVFISSSKIMGRYRRHANATTAGDQVQSRAVVDMLTDFGEHFPQLQKLVNEARYNWMEEHVCKHMQVDKAIDQYGHFQLIGKNHHQLLKHQLAWLPGRCKKFCLKKAIGLQKKRLSAAGH
jgi:hypothetical protein